MARIVQYVVYVAVIALLVLVASLSALPQTFRPLTREREVQSEEELKSTIGSVFKPPVPSIVRGQDGMLKAVFPATTTSPPTTTPAQYEQVVSHAPNKHDSILVLRAEPTGQNETNSANMQIAVDSYPEGYPLERVKRILREKEEIYRDVFDKELLTDALVTRIDSPSDQYLCSSTRRLRYPTYHPQAKVNIVNVEGFYQSVTFETCDNVGSVCSNVIASFRGKLVCEQVYGEFELYTVPVDNSTKLDRIRLSFPSCCKCKHEMV